MQILKIFNTRQFLLSLVCVLIFNAGTFELFADTAVPSITKAETLMRKGQYLTALIMFNEIARDAGSRDLKARAIYNSGKTYSIYLDQQETALSQFNEIIYNYPESRMVEPALLNCGIIYLNQRKYRNAYPLFAQYLTKFPNGKYTDSARKWAALSQSRMCPLENTDYLGPVIKKPADKDSHIRVLLHRQVSSMRFGSSKTIQVSNPKTGKMIYSGWGPIYIDLRGKDIFLNNQTPLPASVTVSSDVTAMRINGRAYRGFFTVSGETGGLYAVNYVPIESYLYSVVPKEMPNNWPMHALMAQSVAARTYALFMQEKNKLKPYDLQATTASQVYGGYSTETRRATHAVNATTGQVMTYNGRLILAFFHSNSGGYTEDPVHVWDTYIPYLRGVPDQYSKNTPDSTWEYFLSYKEAKRRLNRYGLNINRIRQVKASGMSKSGRNLMIQVVSDSGVTQLKSNHFRESVGETKLKSTCFRIVPGPKGVLFKGKGFGHGVGMSQWGANHMALSGANYIDILKYYYQGIDIVSPRS